MIQMSLMQHLVVRFAPILRLKSLVQQDRAEMVPAVDPESASEARSREALRRLMRCPVVEIVARVLIFARY